jgi:ubiquinone/menaquinone biosynthesis C-methylase UbiE
VLLKGRNHFAPLEDPRKILDIGTGTGKWAIEMGMVMLVRID